MSRQELISDSNGGLSKMRIFRHIPLALPKKEPSPSIPLMVPSNLEYDPATNSFKKKTGEFDAPPQLSLNDDALKLLQTINKPVAVLTICGPFRSGKSYFLSRILGSSDAFKVGHKMQGCTRGIWMATTALECEEFVLLLLDTEGINATGANRSHAITTSNILVMATLASSFLIYNSKDVPQQSDLEKMSCFAQLSSCVYTRDAESDDLPDHHKHFPDLLWLLRNVDLEITDEDDNPMTPTEYIKSQVLVRTKDPGMCSMNDEVVKAIRTLFPSLECRIIPPPKENPAKEPSQTSPKFNEALEEVIQYILGNIKAKKGYIEGDIVDGPTLATLLQQYVSALNSGPQLSLESSWLGVIRPRLEDLARKAVADYESEITKLSLPLEEDSEETAPQEEEVAHVEDVALVAVVAPKDEVGTVVDGAPKDEGGIVAAGAPKGEGGIVAAGAPEGEGDSVAVAAPEGEGDSMVGGAPEGEWGITVGEIPVHATNRGSQTLMGAHNKVLGETLTTLQHEIDCLIPVSSEPTEALKSDILSNFKKRIAEYQQDQEGVLKVKGGVLYQFIVKNYQKSTEQCKEVFTSVYTPLMDNFNQPFLDKINEYVTRAVGPAKQAVLDEKIPEFFEFCSRIAPGPSQKLRVVGRGSTCIKIRWKPPTLHPLLTDHYSVEIQKTKDSGSMWSEIKKTKRLSALISGLSSDTKYSFRVCNVTEKELVGNPSKEVHTETKFSAAARTVTAIVAGVGGGAAIPAVAAVAGAQCLYKGIRSKNTGLASLGAVNVGICAPVSAVLYPIFTPICAPFMGARIGAMAYNKLNHEGDLSDPEPSDYEELNTGD